MLVPGPAVEEESLFMADFHFSRAVASLLVLDLDAPRPPETGRVGEEQRPAWAASLRDGPPAPPAVGRPLPS